MRAEKSYNTKARLSIFGALNIKISPKILVVFFWNFVLICSNDWTMNNSKMFLKENYPSSDMVSCRLVLTDVRNPYSFDWQVSTK